VSFALSSFCADGQHEQPVPVFVHVEFLQTDDGHRGLVERGLGGDGRF
jgi:hypothetical protein